MAWQNLHISQPARISLKHNQLCIDQEHEQTTLPLEDLCCIILDTPQITLTGAVLSALAGAGIVVIQSNKKHHPTMICLPFHSHYKQAEIAHLQIKCSAALKKRLWQQIVQFKIDNQNRHLACIASPLATLSRMTKMIRSGDPNNLEAQAARIYWSALFKNYRRHDENDIRNAMLNYGYAIIRAALSRSIVAAGLLPALGLHHASISNGFNLSDDLIEPLRPVVDSCVFTIVKNANHTELTLEIRRLLVGVMQYSVKMGENIMGLLPAIEKMVFSLVQAISDNDPKKLELPVFMPYEIVPDEI
ncbi:type II CRISPR-associated endonuclease Cas1 [Entomobacter blattae]|uniref:CRISPR-associated endonuclease Cas1 n=1 Tax=Entomobacter blattae TaxID=2762277 RepID=A0A7H1NS49_9PROT|nr:type II CRISPR-associated endonuclease Cas1 [Entomobacter blattae]QNT78609.1 CRISPR-associated endonuclease Cas1 [Entomobacter blattae]